MDGPTFYKVVKESKFQTEIKASQVWIKKEF